MHAILHWALKQAHRWRLVNENVAAATDLLKPQPEEIHPLDAAQAKMLLEAAHGDRLEALYVLAVTAHRRASRPQRGRYRLGTQSASRAAYPLGGQERPHLHYSQEQQGTRVSSS